MKTNLQTPNSDEAVAFILFILCCVLSFFQHPPADITFTLSN